MLYTFKEYQITKLHNSILDRFEHFLDWLQVMLDMPVMIVGLHNSFSNVASGQEKSIREVTPRCVLTYTNINMDRQATTGIQASTQIYSADRDGKAKDNVIEYRRMPTTASFRMQIVLDDPAKAIRLSEYLVMLAMDVPTCRGDEHTESTIIIADNWTITDSFNEDNNFSIDGSVDLNMQIIEPMVTAMSDSQDPLAGVGIQRPDGSWDETPIGQPIWETNEDGTPVLDEDGNPMQATDEDGNLLFGNFVPGGWYRLRHNFAIHPHRIFDDCQETAGDPTRFTRPAGKEVLNPDTVPGQPLTEDQLLPTQKGENPMVGQYNQIEVDEEHETRQIEGDSI